MLHFIGDGQRACASEFAASLLHEVDYGILNHLRVHCERRNLLCVGEAVEHGVGHVAHSALDGKEGGGYAPAFKLTDQELADVCPDSVGGLVGSSEGLDSVERVAHDDAHDLLRVNLENGGAYTVVGVEDRNLTAVGGVLGKIDVVESEERVMKLLVELKHDFLGIFGISRDIAHAHAHYACAIVFHVAHFDNGDVEVAIESVAELLGKLREMLVEIMAIVGVDPLAEVG